MNEEEIHKWIAMGMDIGAHTKSHADLTAISKEKVITEINQSRHDLENKFNLSVADFCYPFGRVNELSSDLVEAAGYFSASTMIRGRANENTNRYLLPRIPINYRTLPHLFLAKILTNYEDFNR